jgi:transcription initiation factor IIF auxiliary subunit
MIKNTVLIVLLLWACQAYAQTISVNNDATPAAKQGYYNWKIYLVATPTILSTIREVVYTLQPTSNPPAQTIKASPWNTNFSYSATGWGEFDIKVKVVYHDPKRTPLYLTHHLHFATINKYLRKVPPTKL